MKQDPTLNKKLSEVEERQNRWLGRRVEAHDAPATFMQIIEQALEASAPMSELEHLTVGSTMGPSGQGGEEQTTIEQFSLCSVQEGSKYDIAELFSPVRMTGMAKEFGLRGGWSVDDRCTDPITGRTYDLRLRKDQNEVRKMIRKDRPLVLTVSPPMHTLFDRESGSDRSSRVGGGSRDDQVRY